MQYTYGEIITKFKFIFEATINRTLASFSKLGMKKRLMDNISAHLYKVCVP